LDPLPPHGELVEPRGVGARWFMVGSASPHLLWRAAPLTLSPHSPPRPLPSWHAAPLTLSPHSPPRPFPLWHATPTPLMVSLSNHGEWEQGRVVRGAPAHPSYGVLRD